MTNYLTEAHFKLFLEENRAYQKEQREFIREVDIGVKEAANHHSVLIAKLVKDLKDQSDRSDSLANQLSSSQEKVLALESRISHLETKLSQLKNQSPKSCKNRHSEDSSQNIAAPLDDPCEILVSDLSSSLKQSPEKIMRHVLTFIGLFSAINHVFATRDWKHKQCRSTGASRAFVVKFLSQIIRNEVLNKISSIKNLNSQSIFGTGNLKKINVIDLLPKPTYLLLLNTRKTFETLNYAPPIVKNGIVYMRKSCHSPLIPIFLEKDLMNLN